MPDSFSVRLRKPVEFTRKAPRCASRRRRRQCARFIDALARPESRPQQMLGPPLIDRMTARLVVPELLRVRPLLLDPDTDLLDAEVRELAGFLMDGQRSALFDRSPDEARQHAQGLVDRLLAAATVR